MGKIRLLHRCENAAHYYYVVPTRTEPEQSTVLMLCLYHRQNVKCKVCRSRDEYKLMALMLCHFTFHSKDHSPQIQSTNVAHSLDSECNSRAQSVLRECKL